MANKLLILIAIIICGTIGYTVPQKVFSLELIKQLEKIVGEKWLVSSKRNKTGFHEIVITSKIPLHHYHCLSLRKMTEEEYNMMVKSSPKIYYSIRLLIFPRWNDSKLQKSILNNKKIIEQLNELPKKYRLNHLSRNKMGSFFSDDPDEKKRIKVFEKERDQLRRRIVILPNFHSKSLSVFIKKSNRVYECVAIPENMRFSFQKIQELLAKI